MPLWKPLHSNWLCSNLAEICQVVLKQRVENVNILQTDGRTGIWMPDKKWSEIKSLCMSHFTILKLSSYGNNGFYMFMQVLTICFHGCQGMSCMEQTLLLVLLLSWIYPHFYHYPTMKETQWFKWIHNIF